VPQVAAFFDRYRVGDNRLETQHTLVKRAGLVASAKSALDLAGALHEIAPKPPIVLASASAGEVRAEELQAAGITGFVHRPLMSAEIAEALARCLRAEANSLRALQA
jgi:hypothetical protein